MVDRTVTNEVVPEDLDQLNAALAGCRRCPLWRDATQAVCGVGPKQSRLMIVGEQPGDNEDLSGQPFIGPAGEVLNHALVEAGLNRDDIYLTNAVKHFKHTVRGRQRLHKTPSAAEIDHCRWWLNRERELVKPELSVAMGSSAARGLFGHTVSVGDLRGRIMHRPDGPVLVTYHPAYILRHPDPAERTRAKLAFEDDLGLAADYLNAV